MHMFNYSWFLYSNNYYTDSTLLYTGKLIFPWGVVFTSCDIDHVKLVAVYDMGPYRGYS